MRSSVIAPEHRDDADRNFFYRLTPDEIIAAVAALGLEPSGHIAQLNSMENRVFDLRLEDGRHLVAKFYRPGRWSREQILEEHAFLFALREAELSCLAPLKIDTGSLFEEQGIYFALWPRTGGREPEELSDIDLQILGRLLARVHNVGAAQRFQCRPQFSVQRFIDEPLALLKEKKFLLPEFETDYENLATLVARKYTELASEIPLHPIHGDLHKGNILNGADGWFLLDFDDALVGPAVQDIWMLFPGTSLDSLRSRAIFLDAYREFREFDDRWLALCEVLRAMRIIHYSGWIARRYEDPAFKAAFPEFANAAYWEEEMNILREICAEFDEKTGDDLRGETLGNKDFFFDWE